MFLFIGLGNKGSKYQNNRHNIGFLFIDYLIRKYNFLKINSKLKSILYRVHLSLLLIFDKLYFFTRYSINKKPVLCLLF